MPDRLIALPAELGEELLHVVKVETLDDRFGSLGVIAG